MTVWLITGASRGLGREIAQQALDRGDSVVATARQPERVTEALPGYGGRPGQGRGRDRGHRHR